MSAVGEIARGKEVPTIFPIWQRDVLSARNPPKPSFPHPEYENNSMISFPEDDIVQRAFFFGPEQLSIFRKFVLPHIQHCTDFEILTACIWKFRTIALQPNPLHIMCIMLLVNARYRHFEPLVLPIGYYGNGFVFSTAQSTAKELIENPVSHTIGLIQKAKECVTREHIQSSMDTLVSKGRPHFRMEGQYTYIIADNTRSGFQEVDFGWGNAIYGGPPRSDPTIASFLVPYRNKKGENEIVFTLCLPTEAMERFVTVLNECLLEKPTKSSFDGEFV